VVAHAALSSVSDHDTQVGANTTPATETLVIMVIASLDPPRSSAQDAQFGNAQFDVAGAGSQLRSRWPLRLTW
jgi:hypothetical protein